MSSENENNVYKLDSAYKPFPTFSVWTSKTTVETGRWDRYNAILNDKTGLTPEILKQARQIATRAAALDTGAIEGLYDVDRGFTYTVAFEAAAWETTLAEKGENVRPLFEAQLHAYDYVLDLATKAEPISEAAIRSLHEQVCRAQSTYRVMTAVGPQEQPLPKGKYKALPNHVRGRNGVDHSYAPVDVTPAEMARLVTEIRSEAFLDAHPVLQAAYAHYCLVVIHPFADGNGRVARALASAFTYRAISMPIVILSDEKDSYLDALEQTDRGEYQQFVDFMLERSLDTIQLVNESAQGAQLPSSVQSVEAINGLYITKGGYTHDQIDKAGTQLLEILRRELIDEVSRQANGKVQGKVFAQMSSQRVPDSTHRATFNRDSTSDIRKFEIDAVAITFSSSVPALAGIKRQYVLWLPKDADGKDDIQIRRDVDGVGDFNARVQELIPSIKSSVQLRVRIFSERIIGEMLAELKLQAEASSRWDP